MTDVGYTKLANDVLEALAKIKLSPMQYRLLFVVWRYTYGYQRGEHDLSLSFLAEATGCDKRQIQRELKDLEDRKIISQKITNGVGRIIGFNPDVNSWASIGEVTNGEMTNGEMTNGDSAIGETTNPSIGEIVKATIGETTNQERNNIKKNLKKNNKQQFEAEFEDWWKGYPRKKSKADARKAWVKLRGEGKAVEELTLYRDRYAAEVKQKNTEEQYILHGSTFLNGKWEDYTQEPAEAKAREPDTYAGWRRAQ